MVSHPNFYIENINVKLKYIYNIVDKPHIMIEIQYVYDV